MTDGLDYTGYILREDLNSALTDLHEDVSKLPISNGRSLGMEISCRMGTMDAIRDVQKVLKTLPYIKNERINDREIINYNGYASQSDLIKRIETLGEKTRYAPESQEGADEYYAGVQLGYQDGISKCLRLVREMPAKQRSALIYKTRIAGEP